MNKKYVDIILVGLVGVITLVRLFLFPITLPGIFTDNFDKKVTMSGKVVSPVVSGEYTFSFNLKPDNQNFLVLVRTYEDPKVFFEDKIKLSGKLEKPKPFETNNGREFNYDTYLESQNILAIVSNSKTTLIERPKYSLKRFLFSIQNNFKNSINKFVYGNEGALANGILLGDKTGFDKKIKDDFIRTGTIHIVALSGYNITIVAEYITSILRQIFSFNISIFGGILGIVFFVIMTGGSATAVRAGIMTIIVLIAKYTGRTNIALRTLVTAGLIMILIEPKVIFNISFQLSFLATFGVIVVAPKIIKYISFVTTRFGIRELLATTLGATIMVMPLIIFSTGVVSVFSVPINIIILPFIPFAMLLSFVVGILGMMYTPLAIPFSEILHILLSLLLKIIHFVSEISFSVFNVPKFSITILIIIYGIIFYFSLRNKKENKL